MRICIALSLLAAASPALASHLEYSMCQAGCMPATCACYAAPAAVFGTVMTGFASTAVLACNKAQGWCYSNCAAKHLP
ncbi:hypothetical protein BKA65DRAFT_489870 [Rhexocercosporidium sp. MPI-PUGE-AT-0058]|nr:hypothetical protein BKA65DRAFT_489870 [Rhexocercosporidium sp. MPI-PUGE-AT-0058]